MLKYNLLQIALYKVFIRFYRRDFAFIGVYQRLKKGFNNGNSMVSRSHDSGS